MFPSDELRKDNEFSSPKQTKFMWIGSVNETKKKGCVEGGKK